MLCLWWKRAGWMFRLREWWYIELHPAGSQSLVTFPRAHFWEQSCLISLSMPWQGDRGHAYLADDTKLCRSVDLLESRKLPSGDGPRPQVRNSTRPSAGSCPWITATAGLGESGWKAGWRKRICGGWEPAEHEPACAQIAKKANDILDCISVVSRTRAVIAHWDCTLSPVFSSGTLTRRKILRGWSEPREGNRAGEGPGGWVIWGTAEEAGSV